MRVNYACELRRCRREKHQTGSGRGRTARRVRRQKGLLPPAPFASPKLTRIKSTRMQGPLLPAPIASPARCCKRRRPACTRARASTQIVQMHARVFIQAPAQTHCRRSHRRSNSLTRGPACAAHTCVHSSVLSVALHSCVHSVTWRPYAPR